VEREEQVLNTSVTRLFSWLRHCSLSVTSPDARRTLNCSTTRASTAAAAAAGVIKGASAVGTRHCATIELLEGVSRCVEETAGERGAVAPSDGMKIPDR